MSTHKIITISSQLIARGKTGEAINQLLRFSENGFLDKQLTENLLLLSSRYNSLKQNNIIGIITNSDFHTLSNQISHSLLELINDISDFLSSSEIHSERDGLSETNNYENSVFVSYAWGGESERTVNELEKAFSKHSINIVRDKRDLEYKGSIEAFEQRISKGQCVVLVISDKYLRSEHCMYELAELEKNQNLRERVFPIVLSDAKIYKAIDRLNYVQHWDKQIEQLNQAIKQVGIMTNLVGISADLDKYASIRASLDHLTDLLSDMNALTPDIHAGNDFSVLITAVKNSMTKK